MSFFPCASSTPTERAGAGVPGLPNVHSLGKLSSFLASKWRASSGFLQHRVTPGFVSWWSWRQMSLTEYCLWVKRGYYCHYFFLIKCLPQSRCHMGWYVSAHPARPERDSARTKLHGGSPEEGAPASEQLGCISGWQCDFQLLSVTPQSYFKSLSDTNPVGTSWLWSLHFFIPKNSKFSPLEYFF